MQNRPLSRINLPTESVKHLQAYIKSIQNKPNKNKGPGTSNLSPETPVVSSASTAPSTRRSTRRIATGLLAEMEHDSSS